MNDPIPPKTNERTITTQAGLDEALADGVGTIYVDSPSGVWLLLTDSGSSRVVARDSSSVVAWGSSRVEAWGSSRVVARRPWREKTQNLCELCRLAPAM